jgi:hypothetical protein
VQWFNKLFRVAYYTSELDALLTRLNGASGYNTPGKAAKVAYYRNLVQKRDTKALSE